MTGVAGVWGVGMIQNDWCCWGLGCWYDTE